MESCIYPSLAVSVPCYILLHLAPFPQAKVAQWLQKALDGEVVEWGREQEPDTDLSGFYHSPLPAIVLQVGEKWQGAALTGKGKEGRTRTPLMAAHPCL